MYSGRMMGAEQEKALIKLQKMLEEARNREARLEAELAKVRVGQGGTLLRVDHVASRFCMNMRGTPYSKTPS